MKFDPKSVFDLHPDANEVFEVEGMPFLRKVDAESYATSIKAKVVVHTKGKKAPEANAEEAKKAAEANAEEAKKA